MAISTPKLPKLGAAMNIGEIAHFQDFLFETDRDLEIQDFIGTDVLDGNFDNAVKRLKKALEGYGGRLSLHGPFKGFSIYCKDELIMEAVRARISKCLDAVEAVGATQMVLHSPYSFWAAQNDQILNGYVNKMVEQTAGLLEPLVKRAHDIGCVIVIENIEDPDPEFRKTLIDMIDSPALKASLDTGHAHCSIGIQADSATSQQHIDGLGDRLVHMHLHDNYTDGDWHHIPGQGNIEWEVVFDSIKNLTAPPRLILELRDRKELAKAAQYLIDKGLCV